MIPNVIVLNVFLLIITITREGVQSGTTGHPWSVGMILLYNSIPQTARMEYLLLELFHKFYLILKSSIDSFSDETVLKLLMFQFPRRLYSIMSYIYIYSDKSLFSITSILGCLYYELHGVIVLVSGSKHDLFLNQSRSCFLCLKKLFHV